MNTPFQDTYLSTDNLRLYLETPESELIRNVNPAGQQTAIIAKRQYSQSPSPESKLRKGQNISRSGKLSLHLLPKLALSSINANEQIQLATQRNAETQSQPLIDFSRCNSLRSLSPSQLQQQPYQRSQHLQASQSSQLQAEDQATATREAFMRMKYMNTMKNTFCLRNQIRAVGSQSRDFCRIAEHSSFEFSPKKGYSKTDHSSQNQLAESNQQEELNQDFGIQVKAALSQRTTAGAVNCTPKKIGATKGGLPSKWISSDTKYDKILYLMNKVNNKERLDRDENIRKKTKFIRNEGFSCSTINITNNSTTTNPYFSLLGVSSKSIFNKEQLLLNSQRSTTRSYQYLPAANTLRSFHEKRYTTTATSSEQDSLQETNSQLELHQQNSAPIAAAAVETPVAVQSPRKIVLETPLKAPFKPPQVIKSEKKVAQKESYNTKQSLLNLIQQQDLNAHANHLNHNDSEIQGSQSKDNNNKDLQAVSQGQNRRIQQHKSINSQEELKRKPLNHAESAQNLHSSSSLKKGLSYKVKEVQNVNAQSNQALQIAGKSKEIRQEQTQPQMEDFMAIFQMSKYNMQRQLAKEAEQIRRLDNVVEEQFMRQKQIEQAREAERQLRKQMERGFGQGESEKGGGEEEEEIKKEFEGLRQNRSQQIKLQRFYKGSSKSQELIRYLPRQSSLSSAQEARPRGFEITSGNVRMKFIRIDSNGNFKEKAGKLDKTQLPTQREQLIQEDKVKSTKKVREEGEVEGGGGERDNSERLTEEKVIGWGKNNDEEIVEEEDDDGDREKIDVISDIHKVIGSEGQSEQRNIQYRKDNLDEQMVVSYVQRASMDAAENQTQEGFQLGVRREGTEQIEGNAVVENVQEGRNNARVSNFLRPLLLKEVHKRNNKNESIGEIQKEDRSQQEQGQLDDIPADFVGNLMSKSRNSEATAAAAGVIPTMAENDKVMNKELVERKQIKKIVNENNEKVHKLEAGSDGVVKIGEEEIVAQGNEWQRQEEVDKELIKDSKEREEEMQDRQELTIRRGSKQQYIDKGQIITQKQEQQHSEKQVNLSSTQMLSTSDHLSQPMDGSQEYEDSEQKMQDSDSTEKDNFRLKKYIDFDKLKALRDKTINRLSVQANQRKPASFAAVVSAVVQAQHQQQTTKQTQNSLTKQKTSKFSKKNNKNKMGKQEEKQDTAVVEVLSEEQKKQAKQREQDSKIAQKLEQIKEKVKQEVKVIINDMLERKLDSQKSRSNGQHEKEEEIDVQDDGLIELNTRNIKENNGQIQSVEEYHTAVMELYSTCIDDLRETGNNHNNIDKTLNNGKNPSIPEKTSTEHDLELQKMRHFDAGMSASIGKTVEMELRKTNLNEADIDRFRYIYEINTKVHVLYTGMVRMLGGADKVRKLVIAVLDRIASHLPMLPIQYEWSYETIHRRIIPGICALLCDDQQFFFRNLRQFSKVHEFSFIDFCFAKRETFLFLTGNKCRKTLFPEISEKLILGVIQRIESVRRYLYPVKILADDEIREVIVRGLMNCEEFVKLFIVNKLTTEFLGNLLGQLFDYFYSDAQTESPPKLPKIRAICQPLLAQTLSRKLLDYIEVFTLKALQKERFTLNLLLRDLHYKFCKVRLRLGFEQGIFGHFDTFEDIDRLIAQLELEVKAAIHYGAADFLPESQLDKLTDLKFLKIYLKFLLAEHDIFSVFDIAVAMPYDGVSHSRFLFWMDCLRSVILTKYDFLPAQAHVFIRFLEACCPTL